MTSSPAPSSFDELALKLGFPLVLTAIKTPFSPKGCSKRSVVCSKFFSVRRAEAFSKHLSESGHNIYWFPQECGEIKNFSPPKKKDVCSVRYLCIDIDKSPSQSLDQIMNLFRKESWPSCIRKGVSLVQTGNGLQIFIKLSPYSSNISSCERKVKYLMKSLEEECGIKTDRSAFNINRVFRFPMLFPNYPSESKLRKNKELGFEFYKPVIPRILKWSDETFHPDTFPEIKERRVLKKKKVSSSEKLDSLIEIPDLRIYASKFPKGLQDLILVRKENPDRSLQVYRTITGLIDENMNDETILSILLHRDYAYFDRTSLKGKKHCIEEIRRIRRKHSLRLGKKQEFIHKSPFPRR